MNKFNLEDIVAEKADPSNLGVVIRTPDELGEGRYEVEFSEGTVEFNEDELEKR